MHEIRSWAATSGYSTPLLRIHLTYRKPRRLEELAGFDDLRGGASPDLIGGDLTVGEADGEFR